MGYLKHPYSTRMVILVSPTAPLRLGMLLVKMPAGRGIIGEENICTRFGEVQKPILRFSVQHEATAIISA